MDCISRLDHALGADPDNEMDQQLKNWADEFKNKVMPLVLDIVNLAIRTSRNGLSPYRLIESKEQMTTFLRRLKTYCGKVHEISVSAEKFVDSAPDEAFPCIITNEKMDLLIKTTILNHEPEYKYMLGLTTNLGIGLYHEKQSYGYCVKHAFNNLMQRKDAYTFQMDGVNKEIKGPPKSFFESFIRSFGSYSVLTLDKFLKKRGHELKCYDDAALEDFFKQDDVIQRKGILDTLGSCLGLVIELPGKYSSWLFPYGHVYAVKRIKGIYINFDSCLDKPQLIGDTEVCISWIIGQLREKDVQVMFVMRREEDEESDYEN